MDKKDTWSACISSLKRELECPVCLDTMVPPLRQCSRGHIICLSCAERVGQCSLCHRPFLSDNPIFVNNLLAVIPRPCKFSQRGCNEICITNDQHEIYCGFRSIWCRDFRSCQVLTQVCELLKHYEESHRQTCPIIKSHKGEFVCGPFRSYDRSSERKRHVPIFFDGTFFHIYLHYKVKESCFKIFLEAHFTNKPVKEYFVNITLVKGNFVAMSTLSPFINRGEVATSLKDLFSMTLARHEDLCMRVSQRNLCQLLDDDQKLKVSFSFFKR